MNRRLTFLIAAFEALVVAGIGIGILLAPLTVVWLFENDPTIEWLVPFRASADVWMMAHGTRLVVPAGMFGSSEVPAFVISLIPLGLSALIAYLAIRLGKKLTTALELWPAWVAVTLVYGAVSLFLSTAAYNEFAYPVTWQGTFFPPAFFLFFVVLGSLFGKRQAFGEAANLPESAERVWIREWAQQKFNNLHWAIRAVSAPALRAGTGVVAILLGVSSIFIAGMLAINWIQVIRLYEGLQVSFLGGFMVTAGQIAVLPNLVVMGASWLTGVGFQFGAGSLISPVATVVGPLPALPVTSALPIGELSFGMIALMVPLVGAFVATIMIRRHADAIRFEFASAWSAAITLGLSIASVASVEMGLLALLASGGIGPGRLQVIGVNPLLVTGVLFVEVAAVSILAAFFSARPDKADHPLAQR
ncbi:MAG: hypothetical protein RL723_1260 [Actinomycetota bacterium]